MIDVVGYGSFQRQLSDMHDTRTMAAPPGSRLPHPLQAVSSENHTSVIKKIDHSVESILPNTKHSSDRNEYCADQATDVFGGNNEEAMLDDDFSDHDSHYSEDFEDIQEHLPPEPDVTRQLLDFADMVSSDIQKFFGRKKGEEDSCDIYEDKWYSAKSGRELYYADLMKIVQGEDKHGKRNSISPPLLDISNSVKDSKDNRNSFSGKLDKKLGVGPLNELFDYGLRHFLTDRKLKTKELKRLKSDVKKFDDVRPMHERKLPSSFWREPGSQPSTMSQPRSTVGNPVLQSNNPPDFSDLLESWRLDRSEFSGELSSSSMSPESV